MNIIESARIALRGLRANRLRSALTTLGIIIGVAAVIILTAFGNGIQASFLSTFGAFANQIQVNKLQGAVPGGGVAKALTDADVEALRNPSRAPDISKVTPTVNGQAVLQLAGEEPNPASVIGTTADYLQVNNRDLIAGVMFDESQVRTKAKVVVLGTQTVAELFAGDAASAIGKQLRVGRTSFRVIGVAEESGQGDDYAIMPLGAARSSLLGGGDEVDSITVTAASSEAVPAAQAQIYSILDVRHKINDPNERDYQSTALGSILEQVNTTLTILTAFTVAVAGISLVVGSIGVANIMLVTVTERTREIGIRKAIGARRKAILQQFLLESMFLSGLGGLIGIAIGVGLVLAIGAIGPSLLPGFPVPVITSGPIILSFSVSLVIGILAGVIPANRAARLRPIEALRYQ